MMVLPIEAITPAAIELSLAVQEELQSRMDEADRLRRKQVERARCEALLAQRRYRRVDPDNRLVADALEADWNKKLRPLLEAEREYRRQHAEDQKRWTRSIGAWLWICPPVFPACGTISVRLTATETAGAPDSGGCYPY